VTSNSFLKIAVLNFSEMKFKKLHLVSAKRFKIWKKIKISPKKLKIKVK
jgi:hypothetical protein